jgi:hypothetical protein
VFVVESTLLGQDLAGSLVFLALPNLFEVGCQFFDAAWDGSVRSVKSAAEGGTVSAQAWCSVTWGMGRRRRSTNGKFHSLYTPTACQIMPNESFLFDVCHPLPVQHDSSSSFLPVVFLDQ